MILELLENPFEVASKFCANNNLATTAVPQIVDFIIGNVPQPPARIWETMDAGDGAKSALLFDEIDEYTVLRKLKDVEKVESSKVFICLVSH